MASNVRRRWYYILGVICCAIALAYVLLSPTAEPSYEGRTLSEWLDSQQINTATKQPFRSQKAFTRAIDQMGTNAIPFLVKHIRSVDKPGRTAICNYLRSNFPNSRIATRLIDWLDNPVCRGWEAVCAFEVLGSRAEPAVPLLAHCLDRQGSALFAARALTLLGEKGFPPILATLTNDQTTCAEMITIALELAGTNAAPAIPALVHNLQSTNSQLAAGSQRALNQITNRNTGPVIR